MMTQGHGLLTDSSSGTAVSYNRLKSPIVAFRCRPGSLATVDMDTREVAGAGVTLVAGRRETPARRRTDKGVIEHSCELQNEC